jgi:hypothetical protein
MVTVIPFKNIIHLKQQVSNSLAKPKRTETKTNLL